MPFPNNPTPYGKIPGMTYPDHWYFVMGGTLGGGTDAEIWQCGIRGLFGSPPTDAEADDWLNATTTALETYWADTTSSLRSDALLAYTKMNEIAPSGHYLEVDSRTFDVSPPVAGHAGPNMPGFLSVAYSWTTDAVRGPASRGRIYPPNVFGVAAAGSERIGSSSLTLLSVAAANLIDLLNTDRDGVQFECRVVSNVGSGSSRKITGVRVGDVIDVQRRRKNALVENYTAVPVS
uniref:Uncharacterized protein n=1 Tax=uncultured prokaryote TaxID=198431 RepID=A0A0H5QNJ7_9ZZZZ|nr:hypothetical protein [uncultured prokaryote]